MKKVIGCMMISLIILVLLVPAGDAVSADRVFLGNLSIEAPRGWSLSGDGKRIIGKPAAGENASSKEWYALSSELFVIMGPEADAGGDLSASLKKFMEDTFVGYAEIELKFFSLKIPGGVENLGYSGSIRNSSSGDVIYAVFMVLRYRRLRYFFVYNIDNEDRFREFVKGSLVQIMDSLKFSDGSFKRGEK